MNFGFEVDPGVDQGTLVPRMILQIPAENAIKHGLFPKPEGGDLTIRISNLSDTALLMFIQDDGVGRGKARESGRESNGRGLRIIQEMLELLNKTEGTSNNLRIVDLFTQDKPSGTMVEIILSSARRDR